MKDAKRGVAFGERTRISVLFSVIFFASVLFNVILFTERKTTDYLIKTVFDKATACAAASGGAAKVQATAAKPSKAMSFVAPRQRTDLGDLLQSLGFKTGVELGVQRGEFSKGTLRAWKSCEKYYLVDIWQHQANYEDIANVPQEEQDRFLNDAKNNLKEFESKTVFVRKFTNQAVADIPNDLDYVYVDARHDYCGVDEDIRLYWAKMKPGGLMAGHDYLDAPQVKAISGQDWALCMNGSRYDGAVKQAVDDFAREQGLPVYVTYQDPPWSSWMLWKPLV